MRNRFAQAHASPRPLTQRLCRCGLFLVLGLACANTTIAAEAETRTTPTGGTSVVRIVDPTQPQVQLKRLPIRDLAAPTAFYEETELTLCRTRPQRFCRDLAKAEFEITSLRPMVPSVPRLTAKSLTFRHNAVIANYTFR